MNKQTLWLTVAGTLAFDDENSARKFFNQHSYLNWDSNRNEVAIGGVLLVKISQTSLKDEI